MSPVAQKRLDLEEGTVCAGPHWDGSVIAPSGITSNHIKNEFSSGTQGFEVTCGCSGAFPSELAGLDLFAQSTLGRSFPEQGSRC